MAVSRFEGFEKRLELHFSGDDPLGLRRLPTSTIQLVLDAVQCSIVSAAGNRCLDAYILSESSLFVYPHKIIIKTCGTTQLLNSVPLLLQHSASLGLRLSFCRYSRGSFIFPTAQPFPYSNFGREVDALDRFMPTHLPFRKADILPSDTQRYWHVYLASDRQGPQFEHELFTMEVCMTALDRGLASAFCHKEGTSEFSGDDVGRKMTAAAGVDDINPRSIVFGYAFDPCGYSMNGLDRDRYSTIHVTPEEGYSYASFECVDKRWDGKTVSMLERAVRVFGPGELSVSVTGYCGPVETVWGAIENAVRAMGLECRTRAAEDFPGAGAVTYQTFTARRHRK